MHSVTSNAVAEAISYSFTEHQIGYWCDGKPLYEISQLINITDNGVYIESVPGERQVKAWGGSYYQVDDGITYVLSVPYTYVDSNAFVKVYGYISVNGIVLICDGSGPYASGYFHGSILLTYKYTKTTD